MGNNTTNRINSIRIILFCSAFVLLSGMFFAFFRLKDVSEAPDNTFGFAEKDIVLYLEAVTRIKKDALFLTPTITRKKIVQDTLKSYLTQNDTFSDYLTREEYLRFKKSQDEEYVGIGMEIEKDRNGRIICFPYPGSPAERVGISVGDQLKSIDGIPVYGKSLFTVASMIRDKRETKIGLTVTTRAGMEKQVVVTRSEVRIENVSKRWFEGMPVINIFTFTRSTKGKLEHILSNWGKNNPVIIDLRANSGGDLYAAIDSAMLFLEKGKKIVSIQTRNGYKVYKSSNRAVDLAFPAYLWQDEATASAAEVFIAALTENNKAVSIGKRTFGKGAKQDIIELSDGSALILTTGHLQTPDGIDYQGRGLNPTYKLSDNASEAIHYLSKVKELMGLRNENFSSQAQHPHWR